MTSLEMWVWTAASLGWAFDWASTVWPNEYLPEANPFVRRRFGAHPDPIPFGFAKLLGLVIVAGLFLVAEILISATGYVPNRIAGVPTSLAFPAAVGVVGWHGFVHNLRLHWETRG